MKRWLVFAGLAAAWALDHWLGLGSQPGYQQAFITAAIIGGSLAASGAFSGDDDSDEPLFPQAAFPESAEFLERIFAGLDPNDVIDFLSDPINLTRLERLSPLLAENIFGLPLKPKAQARLGPELFEATRGLFPQSVEDLSALVPIAMAFAQTGLPPGGIESIIGAAEKIINPVVEASRFRFTEDFDPLARERLSIFGTDLDAARARELSRIGAEVGGLETDVIMDLLGRQLQSLPLAANLAQLPTVFGLEGAQTAGEIGEAFRLRQESTRPGGRILSFLPQLSQLQSVQQFMTPGFDPAGSESANTISALAGNVPGILGAGSSLLGFGAQGPAPGFNFFDVAF